MFTTQVLIPDGWDGGGGGYFEVLQPLEYDKTGAVKCNFTDD